MNIQTLKSEKSAVVVGASLAGLMMGIALAKIGLRVTILEGLVPSHEVAQYFKLTVASRILLQPQSI